MMADLSDNIDDLKNYYQTIKKNNLDAVFGSRFLKNSKISEYPFKKLFLNRIFNNIVRLLFLNSYNDYTNAFKNCMVIMTSNVGARKLQEFGAGVVGVADCSNRSASRSA